MGRERGSVPNQHQRGSGARKRHVEPAHVLQTNKSRPAGAASGQARMRKRANGRVKTNTQTDYQGPQHESPPLLGRRPVGRGRCAHVNAMNVINYRIPYASTCRNPTPAPEESAERSRARTNETTTTSASRPC
jgi:hypothetical protein